MLRKNLFAVALAHMITCDAYVQVDRIQGHQLNITNPDKSSIWRLR